MRFFKVSKVLHSPLCINFLIIGSLALQKLNQKHQGIYRKRNFII